MEEGIRKRSEEREEEGILTKIKIKKFKKEGRKKE